MNITDATRNVNSRMETLNRTMRELINFMRGPAPEKGSPVRNQPTAVPVLMAEIESVLNRMSEFDENFKEVASLILSQESLQMNEKVTSTYSSSPQIMRN